MPLHFVEHFFFRTFLELWLPEMAATKLVRLVAEGT